MSQSTKIKETELGNLEFFTQQYFHSTRTRQTAKSVTKNFLVFVRVISQRTSRFRYNTQNEIKVKNPIFTRTISSKIAEEPQASKLSSKAHKNLQQVTFAKAFAVSRIVSIVSVLAGDLH